MLGRGYICETCVSAFNRKREQENYEIYMSDMAAALVKLLTGGKQDITRYYDLAHPKPIDNRSGEEIAMDIIKKHGLKAVG